MKNHPGYHQLELRVRLQLRTQQLSLFVERSWRACWPFIALISSFLALSLFDVWRYVPFWLQDIVLLGVLLAAFFILRRRRNQFHWPSIQEGARRLEQQGNVKHRPFDALLDARSPVGQSNPDIAALWQKYRKQKRSDIGDLKAGAPRAGLQRIDPRALRLGLLIVLILGAIDSGADWSNRLERGFLFHWAGSPNRVVVDLWISPPEYTGLSPRTLRVAADGPLSSYASPRSVDIPEGSTMDMRISGSTREPVVMVNDEALSIEATGSDSFHAEARITEGKEISLEVGSTIDAIWRIRVIPDKAPEVKFTETPAPTERFALKVPYEINDDYGVKEVTLSITKVGFSDARAISLTLPGGATAAGSVRHNTYHDLTAHPWAGSTVNARLEAVDGKSQLAQSERLQFALPERTFTHPVAKNLVSIRKTLFFSPDRINAAARRIELQSHRRAEYDQNLFIYTALRSAYWTLREQGERQIESVTDLLWKVALRLEDGQSSLAASAMRDAFDRLSEQLENGELDGDFDSFADNLMRQMEEFLSNQQNGEPIPGAQSQAGQTRTIDMETIERMVQQMKDLAAAGRTQEALEILRELRDIMENIQPGPMTAEDYQEFMDGVENLNKLKELRDAQQDLMDRTGRESLGQALRQRMGEEPRSMEGLASEQRGLGEQLDETMNSMSEGQTPAPEGLGEARGSMQGAEENLREGDTGEALSDQGRALEQLDQAFNQLREQLSQQLQQMQAQNGGRDPLGRGENAGRDNQIEIPTERDIQKAYRILEELRERLGERDRDNGELEYIRRLLRRY